MTLIEMEPALRAEVNRITNRALFERACTDDGHLAGCETAGELLVTLEDASAEGYPEREALIRGAIAAYQRAPHPFWSSVLILAFMPMLRNLLRRAITGPCFDSGEIEQIALARFLGVVAGFDLQRHTDKTFARVRSATEDAVFADLVAEQVDHGRSERRPTDEVEKIVEEIGASGRGVWPAHSQPRRRRRPVDVKARTAFLEEHAAPHLNAEQLGLVMATLGRGESLVQHVRDRYPHVGDAERRRIYQRLKRCHSRAVQRLREVLGPSPSPTEADCGGALPS